MENPSVQIAESLKKANNILVTVSRNPSVDQLSAAIGLTLALNKLGKHAIAVFSGQVPSTIEFLKPEETLERTTDSLRDFIISLDKSKADKLRYKVENQLVKIFITPYKTSLSQDDLEFSQGDFNVEVVLALGVHEQTDLDEAITAHGRILHDATVAGISADQPSNLGGVNWTESNSSSLCEMATKLVLKMKEGILDTQMSTALLTGIVAETGRFSNDKTTPETMQISSQLMSAGANQKLVADELQPEPPQPPADPPAQKRHQPDGALSIAHDEQPSQPDEPSEQEQPEQPNHGIHIDEHGEMRHHDELPEPADDQAGEDVNSQPSQSSQNLPPSASPRRGLALQPPTFGGSLTSNDKPESLDPSVDIIGAGAVNRPRTMLKRENQDTKQENNDNPLMAGEPEEPQSEPEQSNDQPLPEPPSKQAKSVEPTLTSIEESVDSPHLSQELVNQAQAESDEQPQAQPVQPTPELENARAVMVDAAEKQAQPQEADQPAQTPETENSPPPAQQSEENPSEEPSTQQEESEGELQIDNTASDPGLPPDLLAGPATQPDVQDPNAPPPVPPPMMPPNDPSNPNPQ